MKASLSVRKPETAATMPTASGQATVRMKIL